MSRQEDLSKLSDSDINQIIARLFLECEYIYENDNVVIIGVQTILGAYGEPEERQVKQGFFEPCSNPSDIMPIAFEVKGFGLWHGIDGTWNATFGKIFSPKIEWNTRPLRAACECVILSMEAKL